MTTHDTALRTVQIAQWSRGTILTVWAAAALPMGILAWVVAPVLAHAFSGPAALDRAVTLSLTAGLIWQFILVLVLVRREQGKLSWPVVRDALWLRAPVHPRSGRRGGLLWLVLVPCILLFGAEEFMPSMMPTAGHDLPTFLRSDAGSVLLADSWAWFAVIAALTIFNTVLGEELLFRGLLLPRMREAFGRGDWVANGLLFAVYHLHMPWAIPVALVDTIAIALPSRRYRSALIGIIVHSAQSVVVLAGALSVVLG
jgi:membrane protease YdiL (CAAX protease family)